MAIVHQLNKKTGITYVYESYSYRDKITKQPRSKRKLIGRLDEVTGEIIPTRKKAKCVTTSPDSSVGTTTSDNTSCPEPFLPLIQEKDEIIRDLRREIAHLKKEREQLAGELRRLSERLQQQ